jgi:hypothetical protein
MSLTMFVQVRYITLAFLILVVFENIAQALTYSEEPPAQIETSMFAVRSDHELGDALTRIGEDLKQAQASNHELKPEIIIKDPNQNDRGPRLLMAITRGIVSGVAVSWTLAISSDVKGDQAITVGTLSGIGSFFIQYHVQKVQNYLGRGHSLLSKCLRWMSLESAFLTVLAGGLTISGIADRNLTENLIWIASTSAIGLAYQGIWDIVITEKRNEDLKKSSPYSARKTKTASAARALAVAFVSTAIATATSQVNLQTAGYTAALVMGALGLGKYVLQKVSFRNAQGHKGLCESLLEAVL